jgi:cell division protein FtsB
MATATQVLPASPRRVRNALVGGRAPVREVYFVKRIDNSRIIREVDGVKRRECYALGALIGLAFVLCFVYAWQHFQCVSLSYEIEQLRQQHSALNEWNQELKDQRAELEDPKHIDALARADLGLAPADPRQLVRVDDLDTRPAPGEPQLAEARSAPGRSLPAWVGQP